MAVGHQFDSLLNFVCVLVQADRERALGIMTSSFLHDLKQDDIKMYTSQYSIIQDIVKPIWTEVDKLLPKLHFAIEQLEQNKMHYKSYFPSSATTTGSDHHHTKK